MIQRHKKHNSHIKLYISTAAIFCIFLAAYFILKKTVTDSDNKPQTLPNGYVNCNQAKNATAPISASSLLNDKNDIQLINAQKNGIKPFNTNTEFDSLIPSMVARYDLVEVKDCRLYHLKSLKHSHPYLIPEAVYLIDEIAIRFQQKLKEKKLGNYCFFITSLLRTIETQEKLSHRNGNATEHSTHLYGTTVDISYKHFYDLDNDSVVPSWEVIQELTKTLIEMREECKLLVVRERKQSCFHLTVVMCKPEATKPETDSEENE